MAERRLIGLGTWIDKLAWTIVEREKSLGRSLEMLRTEAGIAASGFVHIGSMSDSVRAYAVSLALRNLGYNSEMVQFADDMDGLRSVPAEIPKEYEKYLLQPVSLIPDPFGCHESYAVHMENMLLEVLSKAGIEAKLYRGYSMYGEGALKKQITQILSNWRKIGEMIEALTGQQKFRTMLPYFPLCSSCGRIYTTHADSFDEKTGRVHYVCKGVGIKKRWFDGCGYDGEADVSKAEGKLSWKVEWAARWAALDVRFEAYGKDLADSVKVNDWVCRNILGFEPPMHVQYELFLDESRRKISKSRGVSVFTPNAWYSYASPQSLILLLLKRIKGTRVVSPSLIPALMNELDALARQYYSGKGDQRRTGLYQYVYLLNPPKDPPNTIPYNLLVFLASLSPQGREIDFILSKLKRYGYRVDEQAEERAKMALNYYRSFGQPAAEKLALEGSVKTAVAEVAEAVKRAPDADRLQSMVFEIARKHEIKPQTLFQTLYRILLGQDSGPRFATFVVEDLGRERAYELIRSCLA
ncbi:MAG: lysine--tRNA ligase [Candidatus Caldarchaeum sp.]|uniref:Lysine--tRNA ligase n=1 Tax=Caldiarchaeum subterraneum TaxID=311458 RepID=A0A7C5L7D6_CALS0